MTQPAIIAILGGGYAGLFAAHTDLTTPEQWLASSINGD
jgi:hypothetical protein